MFGTNPIRGREKHSGHTLQVREIFYTIQGEGLFAGSPAVFVRLTGCNLACTFCDTKWDDVNDGTMQAEEVMRAVIRVAPPHCRLIVLTGGEPTRQTLLPFLEAVERLGVGEWRVQVETNGMFWQDALLRDFVSIVVSPKTAKIHPMIWRYAHAFKYVIGAGETSAEDGLPCKSTQKEGEDVLLARPRPGAKVYVSPCDDYNEEANQRNHEETARVAMQYGYTVSVQQHKYLHVP